MPTAELTEDGTGILVDCQFSDNHLISAIPGTGWRDEPVGKWHVTASWPACLILRDLFGARLTLGPRLIAWGNEQASAQNMRAYLRSRTGVDPEWALALGSVVPDGQRLYEFQQAGAWWLGLGAPSLLADDLGAGKTVQSAMGARMAQSLGIGALPVLVICAAPARVMWQRELAKWAPQWRAEIIDGSAVKRRKIIEDGADVLIISWSALRHHTRLAPYSGLKSQRCPACGGERDPSTGQAMVRDVSCETHERELNRIQFGTVICDEAHRGKDPAAKQTRAWWQVSWQARVRYALTGTPVESDIGDLWSILHGIDPAAFPGKSKFLDMFGTVSHGFWGGTQVLGIKPERQELFHRILGLYMRRLPKELILPQLPPRLPPVYRYPEMGARQRQAYRQMTDDMIARLNDLLIAPNPLAKLAHQVSLCSASGRMAGKVCRKCKGTGQLAVEPSAYYPNGVMACLTCQGTGRVQVLELEEPSCKVDDLLEFLGDYPRDEPLVVFAVRRQLIELAARRLVRERISHVLVTGAQSDAEKNMAVDMFQNGDHRARLLLATIRAGSESLTLTAASTAFFMQRDPSHTKNYQAEGRIHRIGSEGHDAISYVISLTEGTIESRIEQLLAEKGERFEEVVRDRRTLEWLVKGD